MSSSITWSRTGIRPPRNEACFGIGRMESRPERGNGTRVGRAAIIHLDGPSNRLDSSALAAYRTAAEQLAEEVAVGPEILRFEISGHAELLQVLPAFRRARVWDFLVLDLLTEGLCQAGEASEDCVGRLLVETLRPLGLDRFHIHDETLAKAIARISDGPESVASPPDEQAFDAEGNPGAPLEPIRSHNLTLQVDHRDLLNYAMVGAGIPLIRAISLTNGEHAALRDIVISIAVLSSQSDNPIAEKSAQLGELAPGACKSWDRPELTFDARALVVLDEATEGSIVVTVSQGEDLLASENLPIRLLSYNQWCRIDGAFELLAAHVLPNHPTIEEIRTRASGIARASTGTSKQEGYQSGGKRAIEIARSNFLALRERKIRYSNPPASFELGQKIRTPDQMLGDRFGTCLDTTCLLAACLEQAGLHPVLFVVKNHAFMGVWVEEDRGFPDASTEEVEKVKNAVDAGLLWPIETTFLTEDENKDFDDAVAEGKKRLAALAFESAVDVRVARHHNVRPLPSRTTQDGHVVVVQQVGSAAAGTTIVAGQRRFHAPKGGPRSPAPRRMQRWKEDLLDLSLRNPLLQLKLGRGGGMKVITPSKSIHEIENWLATEGALSLVAHDQLSEIQKQRGIRFAQAMADDELRQHFVEHRGLFVSVEEAKLRTSVRRLMTKARSLEEESGSNVLHLTLGTLVWRDPEKGKDVRSPLIVLPVRLHTQARGKPPQLTADLNSGGTAINQCLLQKLRTVFRLEVPALATWRGDADGADLRAPLEAMRLAIQEQGLAMSIEEDACLCLLHFGKFRMWKDLDDHWETILEQPVVRHLVEEAGNTFINKVALPTREDIETQNVHCPIPCDGSQLEAVVAAARGCSFVLEGPPGTGKSQTIANLIANALASGKKVLFVAEKRAALEVVKSRLHRVGLGSFCLDIHGKATTPQQLREQLLRSLGSPLGVDRRPWEQGRRELGQITERLRCYAQSVHAPNQIGQSLWQAYQEVLVHGEGPRFAVPMSLFQAGASSVAEVRKLLGALPDLAANANLRPQHPWALVAATDITLLDLPALAAAVASVASAFQQAPTLPRAAQHLLSGITTTDQLASLEAVLTAAALGCQLSFEVLQQPPAAAVLDEARKQATGLEALHRSRTELLQVFSPTIFGDELAGLLGQAQKAQKAFFLWRKGRICAAQQRLQPFLLGTAPPYDTLVEYLERALLVRDKGQRAEAAVRALKLLGLQPEWAASRDNAAATLRALAQAYAFAPHLAQGTLAQGLQVVLANVSDATGLLAAASARLCAWRDLQKASGASAAAITSWRDQRPLEAAIVANLSFWERDAKSFLELSRWCQLQQCLESVRKAGMAELASAVQSCQLQAGHALEAFDRSLARHSLEERLATQQLQRFDGKAHANRIRGFLRLRDADSEALKVMVPDKLVDSRPFRPGQRKGQIAELDRKELSRQKGGKSIRALLEAYSEAVITLMPCVLASPDSVAQFLAPGVIDFDIVVFDEASQVPVADAVGAIGRGKAVVVVGDSRQMPPTAFFGRVPNSDEDQEDPPSETDEVPADMESVLSEAVASGLPRIWLSWHYRSQDESLIAFSNRFYYDNRLASFPTPSLRSRGKGVRLLRVAGGVFDSGNTRTNSKEVDAVVAEVRRRLADPVESRRSIGIVALNLQQADLLREALDEAASQDPALQAALIDESENHLFVKNLESVQGDERDVILISLTYAPNRNGQFPMNFGPLNRIGGERRWNVLVTRARQEVVIISSIAPEDIKLDRVSPRAKGVIHMRAYLAMARDGFDKSVDIQMGPVEPPDLYRDQVAERLRELGLHVEIGVGLSTFKVDISVAQVDNPTERLVAILLDGPGYAARPTVQDRDGLPAAVLHDLMGWPKVLRVWLPEWINEQDRVLQDVQAAVAEARSLLVNGAAPSLEIPKNPPAAAPAVAPDLPTAIPTLGPLPASPAVSTPPPMPSEPIAIRASTQVTRDPEDIDYRPYPGGDVLGSKDDVEARASGRARAKIEQAIHEVLAIEAPIQGIRLARLVAKRFGIQKAREDRIQVILDLVPRRLLRKTPFGDFVWSGGIQPETWRSFRRPVPGEAMREFEEIPPEEVRNALAYAAIKGLGLSEEGAIEEVRTVFGIGRVSQQIRSRTLEILEWSIASGHLQRDPKGLILATR